MISSCGAIWRNCSFNFCRVNEFLLRSAMYCLGVETKVDCRMRFNVWARLVPRCGVARKIMARIALMIASYSGSCWPWRYACVSSARVLGIDVVSSVPQEMYLFSDQSAHAVHYKYQRHLVQSACLRPPKEMRASTHSFQLQLLVPAIPGKLEIEQ